jgi:hypothetical protein
MDIKRKTCDIRIWKKKTYLDVSSTIALPVRRNSQHRNLLTVVSATSAPEFRHQQNVFHSVVNRSTPQTLPTVNKNILGTESFYPQKTLLFGIIVLKHGRHFINKPVSELAHARLLPRLSWSWTVLLPGDTHRKPITSITAVLLLFTDSPSYYLLRYYAV